MRHILMRWLYKAVAAAGDGVHGKAWVNEANITIRRTSHYRAPIVGEVPSSWREFIKLCLFWRPIIPSVYHSFQYVFLIENDK